MLIYTPAFQPAMCAAPGAVMMEHMRPLLAAKQTEKMLK